MYLFLTRVDGGYLRQRGWATLVNTTKEAQCRMSRVLFDVQSSLPFKQVVQLQIRHTALGKKLFLFLILFGFIVLSHCLYGSALKT